jgi:hypothetical protein
VACRHHLGWRGHMGCVPRVNEFWTYGRLKCQLKRDMCHPPDWAMCLLLIFLHVALLSGMDGGALDGHNGRMAPNHEA